MFKALKRKLWKSAVVVEFQKIHGINLRAIGDVIGPGTLDDLLTAQYEEAPFNPTLGAQNVTEVLEQSFGVDVASALVTARSLAASASDAAISSNAVSRLMLIGPLLCELAA